MAAIQLSRKLGDKDLRTGTDSKTKVSQKIHNFWQIDANTQSTKESGIYHFLCTLKSQQRERETLISRKCSSQNTGMMRMESEDCLLLAKSVMRPPGNSEQMYEWLRRNSDCCSSTANSSIPAASFLPLEYRVVLKCCSTLKSKEVIMHQAEGMTNVQELALRTRNMVTTWYIYSETKPH